MKKSISKSMWLWSVLLTLTVSAVAQTTHYVDPRGRCDDLNPCHGTIMEAVGATVTGDTIRVFPGEYEETVSFAPGKDNLTLEAYAEHRWPRILAPTGGNSAIVIRASGVVIRHLTLEADGIVVYLPPFASRYDIVIEENHINGVRASDPESNHGIVAVNVSDIAIRNNQIRNVAGSGILLRESPSPNVPNNVVEGNFIFKAGGNGIVVNGRRNLVKENFILSSGDSGIVVTGDEAAVNVIEMNRVVGSRRYGIACLRAPANTHGNVFQNNTALANKECDLFDNHDVPQNTWGENRARTICFGWIKDRQ